MKYIYLLLSLFFLPVFLHAQNIRWELSGQANTTFYPLSGEDKAESLRFQNYGIRIGMAFNKISDIQVGIHHQTRKDYTEAVLQTESRNPRAGRVCLNRGLTHQSSGIEFEVLYRIRKSQFNRVHSFLGFGVAYLSSSSVHEQQDSVITAEVPRRNGTFQSVECGFEADAFIGSQLALILAPGVRFRITHKLHTELEGQIRYFPMYESYLVVGAGAGLVWNFY